VFVKQNQEHSTETDYATLQVGEYFYKEMMKIKRIQITEHKAMHIKLHI
jgi:hypothetical protein